MTMTNAEWMIKHGYKFNDLNVLYTKDVGVYAISIKKNGAYTCLGTIKKTCAIYAFMEWLDQEHVEPILDEAEKRYLAGVIKPFRNKIYKIVKRRSTIVDDEWLSFTGEDIFCAFHLPSFKAGTMYKGMEPEKEYTLEELGL